jgi:EmrB/QacA subfamily drug resistance transporter
VTVARAGGGSPNNGPARGGSAGEPGALGTEFFQNGGAGLSMVLRLAFLAGPMLSMIDSSVVNVAVPTIVADLHTPLNTAAWAVSGYLLGLAGGLGATPWLARRFGTLRAYSASLLAFTVASAVCALVPGIGLLIAARVVQGLVGAPMVPLAMSLLLDKKNDVQTLPASAGVMLFAAPALGPAVGGLLIAGFGWRSVFAINLPIGLLAFADVWAGRNALPGDIRDCGTRLDLPGLILMGAGLGLATFGASQGPARGWLSAASAPAWGGGLALVAAYVLWARARSGPGRSQPAVNLGLLASPRRAISLALACVASVVLFAVLFLAPVFLTGIQHRSTTVAGLVLLPQGVVMGLASWLGNVVVERGKGNAALQAYSVSGGLALLAASTLGLLALTATTPVWVTAALLCGRGAALGLTVQPLVLALVGGLDSARMPDANTLFNIAERLSGSFGIALLATLYATRARASGSLVAAFHDCTVVLAAVSAAGALAALGLRGRGPGPRAAGTVLRNMNRPVRR